MSNFEQLPDVLTAKHIANYLRISRRRVYELLRLRPEAGGIPSFDIGFSKRVDKQDLADWIEQQKTKKAAG